MISLIIVDDEMTIRKGLSREFDWSRYDIELVGEASNGKDGLELALMVHPDIIISDIKMPIMDGLDMSKEIIEKLPTSKIIFLTGYSDFNYAKKALSIKAVDYLLKPVNFNELATVIKNLCKQIKLQKDNKEKRESEEKYFKEALPYLRARLLIQYANEKLKYDDFFLKAKELEIPLNGDNYSVGFIQFDDLMRNLELSTLLQRNSCDLVINKTIKANLCKDTQFCIAYFDSKLFVLIVTKDDSTVIEKFWNSLQNIIFSQLKASVSIGLSKLFKDPSYMGKAIHQATAALDIDKESSVTSFEGDLENIIPILSLNSSEEKQFIDCIRKGDINILDTFIEELMKKYLGSSSKIPQRSREQFCISLIRLAVREGAQFGLSLKDLIGKQRNLYLELTNLKTLDSLIKWVKDLFILICTSLWERESNALPSIISVSMAYAKENYSKQLSVSEIADRMKVTANYFSRLFKKCNGVNFVEWLNNYRIEEAKRQLVNEPDKKIYEIASDTGFNDYKYFAYIFKKYIGCTPQSFRDLRVGCEINKIKGVEKKYYE